MTDLFKRSDFWSHGNALQAFVRVIKQHPQLHLVEAEMETPLFKQVINGEICSDEYNSCVSLVGVTSGVYKEEWKPGATIEFDQRKFDQVPFTYELEVASRSIVIDDHPETTELFLTLASKDLTIRLRIRLLHQIFDEVVAWIATFPTTIVPASPERTMWKPVTEARERLEAIFKRVKGGDSHGS